GEAEVLDQPKHGHIGAIHAAKQEIAQVRRELWPLRDVVRELVRLADEEDNEDLPFTTVQSIYLRDCEDHVLQLLEFADAFTQVANDVRDIYHTSVAARLNDIMRVLTIMASIFIPLGFLAGLYGMNFDTNSPYNLPELSFRYGYPVLISIMVLLGGGMLVYFWRKGWLQSDGTG
ncbi:MAG: CorA family divalent cation transporter, partial [Rickettsiales bacterium]